MKDVPADVYVTLRGTRMLGIKGYNSEIHNKIAKCASDLRLTNDPKIQPLKLHPFITAQFLKARYQRAADLGGSNSASHDVAGKASTEAASGLEGPLPSSLTELLAGGFSSSLCGPLQRAAHNRAASSPGARIKRETDRSQSFYNLII